MPVQAQLNMLVSQISNQLPTNFNQKLDGSSRGRPGRREGTGSRGECPSVNMLLTALIPSNNLALAVEEHPTFWFYVPYHLHEVSFGEFVLQDAANNNVYRTYFTLPEKPGVVSFSPTSAAPLDINKKYRWYFKLYCQDGMNSILTKSSTPVFVSGWVQRVALKPNYERFLKVATTPRERIAIYTQNGIWLSALTHLAKLRLAQPQNATVDNDWVKLLRAVGLEKLAQQPIVGEVKTQDVKQTTDISRADIPDKSVSGHK
ncbi:DUF928 domain-containing protein [Scytonema sp. NUACC21]